MYLSLRVRASSGSLNTAICYKIIDADGEIVLETLYDRFKLTSKKIPLYFSEDLSIH